MRRALAIASGLLVLATLAACGGGDSSPEDTVNAYFDALSAGEPEKLADLFIPEFGEGLSQATLPEITVSNLTLKKVIETEVNAAVAAGYDVNFPTQARVDVIITLVKTDGRWLISTFEPSDAPIESSIMVLVQDETEVPIAGAIVMLIDVETETFRTESTNDAGLAVFSEAPDAVDLSSRIYVTREGYHPGKSRDWPRDAEGLYEVRLTSVDSQPSGPAAELDVTVLVHDEAKVPIAGARVTISNFREEMIRTESTDDEGLADFGKAPAPEGIVATRDGYAPSMAWSVAFGEPYKVGLDSLESLKDAHTIGITVDPPWLAIPMGGGSAEAIVTVYSFGRASRVSVQVADRLFEPSTKFVLESIPGEVILPDTGHAEVNVTIKAASPVLAPGDYTVNVVPKVLEDFDIHGSRGKGGAFLTIKVKAPE